ncbi:MAG: hypothetical protein NTX00_00850 [Candidatus Parcubacteria bacterium]|nr:hypothetical protein [Candidatus Parcubacteria bacterium]
MSRGKNHPRSYKKYKNAITDFNCPLCPKNVDILVPRPDMQNSKKQEFCCQSCAQKITETLEANLDLKAA